MPFAGYIKFLGKFILIIVAVLSAGIVVTRVFPGILDDSEVAFCIIAGLFGSMLFDQAESRYHG